MPPPGCLQLSSFAQSTARIAEGDYSNEDIDKLHDIILHAQNLPGKTSPTNALLWTYYTILPHNDVDPDPGYRYLKALFKIAFRRGQGTLFEKFRDVFGEIGIQIELCSPENEKTDHQSEEFEMLNSVAEKNTHRIEDKDEYNLRTYHSQDAQPQELSRQNSESPTLDRTLAKDREPNGVRPLSTSPPDRFQDGNKNFTENFSESTSRPGTPQVHSLPKSKSSQRTGSRIEPTFIRRSNRHDGSLPDSRSLLDRKGSPRTVDRLMLVDESVSIKPHSFPKNLPRSHKFKEEVSPISADASLNNRVTDSESLLDIRALVAFNWRLALFVINKLQDWRNRALELREHNKSRYLLATTSHQRNLLHLALSDWRNALHEKLRMREKDIYFGRVECRVTRVRDIYLLSKTLSHWSNYAAEQVEKTALARRNVVKTRVLSAWRDITIADDLTAQRHFLSKYLRKWILCYYSSIYQNDVAAQLYLKSLMQNNFLGWLRKSMEIKASIWYTNSAKHKLVNRWIAKGKHIGELQYASVTNQQILLCSRVFRIWRSKISKILKHEQYAKIYHCNKTCLKIILKWCKELRIIPARYKIQTKVAIRIKKNLLELWLHRAREERMASEINHSKILHEALTNWRIQVRFRVFHLSFQHRLMQRSLRLLVIETRLNLFSRQRKKARFRDSIQIWKLKWQNTKQHCREQEAVAAETLARKRQNFVLLRWYRCMVLLQQYKLVAGDFKRPQITQRALSKWLTKFRHLQKLEHWAHDARFYLIAAKTLSHWRTSTESLKRGKRKTSYIKLRRIIKLNLARANLHRWRVQAQKAITLRSQAAAVIQNQSTLEKINIFNYWRYRLKNIINLEMSYLEKVLQKYFWIWQDRLRTTNTLRTEALLAQQEHIKHHAIKKWNLKYIQVRAHENCAFDVRQKISKRHFRMIFNFWFQQSLQKKLLKQNTLRDLEVFSGSVAKKYQPSEFGEMLKKKKGPIFDRIAHVTPKPGYLSTPSRRTERVFAAVTAKFSTTPRAPLSTPFGREMRTLWSGGPPSSIRQKGLQRSRLALSNTEVVTKTPLNPASSVVRPKSP